MLPFSHPNPKIYGRTKMTGNSSNKEINNEKEQLSATTYN